MRPSLVRVKREDGATLAVVALSMTLILGMAALTVDFGSSFAKRRRFGIRSIALKTALKNPRRIPTVWK